jgi:predicted DNA-binding antitoxin AbrB/MazE fold protein
MTIQIDAVYLDGVLRPTTPLAIPNGTAVRIAIEAGTSLDPLAAVIGSGDGPASGDVSARHDAYLYGETT